MRPVFNWIWMALACVLCLSRDPTRSVGCGVCQMQVVLVVRVREVAPALPECDAQITALKLLRRPVWGVVVTAVLGAWMLLLLLVFVVDHSWPPITILPRPL